jgi:integrase
MIHVRRGGSSGTTKDKDDRFVPVHPTVGSLLGLPAGKTGRLFRTVTERQLLKRLKGHCKVCDFENRNQYKLHSFRHHFASLCANHPVTYRKALAWLGHSSSQMPDLYYHLHDEGSENAMMALAESAGAGAGEDAGISPIEGTLRATGGQESRKRYKSLKYGDLWNACQT